MKILFLLFLFSFNSLAKDVSPFKKYIYLYNDKYSSKNFEKKRYQVKKKAPQKREISSIEENQILESAGLKKYITSMDSLDKKIFIHRLRRYVPKKLSQFYPEIPKKVLKEAQGKIK